MAGYYKILRAVVLVIATIAMIVVSYLVGVRLAGEDGSGVAPTKGAFLAVGAPALALMVFVLLLTMNLTWRPRLVGTRLVGIGVLGPVGVDLATLSGIRDTSARQGSYLALRDEQTSITVSVKSLSVHGVLDQVADAVRRRQLVGAIALTPGAAGELGVRLGDATGSRPRSRQILVTIGVVVLFFVPLIVGLSV